MASEPTIPDLFPADHEYARCPTCSAPVALLHDSSEGTSAYVPAIEPLQEPPGLHDLSVGELRRVARGLFAERDRLRLLIALDLGALSQGQVAKRLGVDVVTMRGYREQHVAQLLRDMKRPEKGEQADGE